MFHTLILLFLLLLSVLEIALSLRFECISPEGCKINSDKLNFLLIGDTGGLPGLGTTSRQWKVADSMTEVMHQEYSSFVINVGDNIYFIGVDDPHNDRFRKTFEDPYQYINIPWYVLSLFDISNPAQSLGI